MKEQILLVVCAAVQWLDALAQPMLQTWLGTFLPSEQIIICLLVSIIITITVTDRDYRKEYSGVRQGLATVRFWIGWLTTNSRVSAMRVPKGD